MALGRAHTSAKAADPAKLLLILDKRQVEQIRCLGYNSAPIYKPSVAEYPATSSLDHNLNHQNLNVSSLVNVPSFVQILWKSIESVLPNPANKQANKRQWKHNLLGGGTVRQIRTVNATAGSVSFYPRDA